MGQVFFKFILASLAIFYAGGEAEAGAFMNVGGRTSQPIGHYEFCKSNPAECSERPAASEPVRLTPRRWNELLEVNDTVNAAIEPTSDEELYGRADVWAYPVNRGDCEDYVLLKRRRLIQSGWPVGALLITVVRQTNGEGHAVLTVRTDRGDLILDNLESKVLVWERTNYRYVKRQSEVDTGAWMAISDERPVLVGAVKP